MTLNMQCVCKSLRKDYAEVAWIPITVLSGVIGWYIGLAYPKQIFNLMGWLSSLLSASAVFTIFMLCAFVFILIDAATTEKSKAKSETCSSIIWAVELMFLVIDVVSFVMYMIYADATNAGIMAKRSYICESTLVILIFTIINAVTMPMAFAYARCKDEPLEEVEIQNESNNST